MTSFDLDHYLYGDCSQIYLSLLGPNFNGKNIKSFPLLNKLHIWLLESPLLNTPEKDIDHYPPFEIGPTVYKCSTNVLCLLGN